MSKLEQIEKQIIELSIDELEQLKLWLQQRDFDDWDRQMESDFKSGKLDKLIREGLDDHDAGRTTPL